MLNRSLCTSGPPLHVPRRFHKLIRQAAWSPANNLGTRVTVKCSWEECCRAGNQMERMPQKRLERSAPHRKQWSARSFSRHDRGNARISPVRVRKRPCELSLRYCWRQSLPRSAPGQAPAGRIVLSIAGSPDTRNCPNFWGTSPHTIRRLGLWLRACSPARASA